MELTTGLELEFHLMNSDGFLVNAAPEILADRRSEGLLYDEAANTQIEINSDPAESISELHEGLLRKIQLVESILSDYKVLASPIAIENGAGKGTQLIDATRFNQYQSIIGEDEKNLLLGISGTHLHQSQIPERKLEQYWLLSSLDPISYTITSTSPIFKNGVNSINNYRILSTRHGAFKNFPLHGKLQDYPSDLNEVDLMNEIRFIDWLSRAESKIDFEKYFAPDNTGYHPIRKRDHIGPTGTFEVRSFDIAPLQYLLASAALYKGVTKYMVEKDIPTEISKKNLEYKFSKDKIILPNIDTLRFMESEAINKGLRSEHISDYLRTVLEFSEQGLSKEDSMYLTPIREMINTKRNPSRLIMDHMRNRGYQGHHFNPEQSAKANLYMRDLHEASLSQRIY